MKSHPRSIQLHQMKFKKALLPLLGGVLFFSTFAQAGDDPGFILCKHDKIVRTLRIEKADDSRCKAIYTKQGVDQVIGSAQNESSCEGFVAGVKKNLEEASWRCREVKQSRVSDLSEESAQ